MTVDLSRLVPGAARWPFDGAPLPRCGRAVTPLATVVLRLDPADRALVGRVESGLGITLPLTPDTVSGDPDGRHALWLGPDEWLVVGAGGSVSTIQAAVRDAAAGGFATATDTSAGRAALELAGPEARELLESGCPIDLHPRAFGPGSCAQTLVGRINVLLHQVDDQPRYRLWVRPSFARPLAAWLVDAEVGIR